MLLPNFPDHDIERGMKGKTVSASKIFFYWIQIGFAHTATIGTLNDGNIELSSKKWVSYGCQILHEIIICIKNYFIKKQLFFD